MAWKSALSVLHCIEEVSRFDCSSNKFIFDADTLRIAEVALNVGSEVHVQGDVHLLRVAIKELAMLLHKGIECSTFVWISFLTHYFAFN